MVDINDLKEEPNNLEAEKSFIACVFLEPTIMGTTVIKSYHFFAKEYGIIYKAMKRLHKDSKDIMPASVINEIGEHSVVDIDYLYDIATYTYTYSQREGHQDIILEQYNRRKVIKGCTECLALARDQSHPIDELLYKTNTITVDVESVEKTHTLVAGSRDTMTRFFEEKQQPTIQEDMGYKFLSACLGGWRAGALYVLAGATGQGKSTFALNLCIEAIKRGTQCAFFSTEMPAHEIHTRFASREAKVESWKIEKGKEEVALDVVTKIDSGRFKSECNIYDTFSTVKNLERLIAKEASLGTKVVFIDYLQQVRVSNSQSRNLAIGDMTTMLKGMAIRYNIAIVGLSQLNRASQQDLSQAPQLKDLRDSGSIEQDADVVMFVYGYERDWSDNGKKEGLGTIQLGIMKNRHGESGVAEINFLKKYFLFTDRG